MKTLCALLTVIAVLGAALPAAATVVPDPDQSTITTSGGGMMICPAGDGGSEGNPPTVGISVILRDSNGDPLVGYPRDQIWVESAVEGELVFCEGGNLADADTDASGMTAFSGAYAGGGHTEGGLHVYVGGENFTLTPLPIEINSPDINGDLRVNACDVTLFGSDYYAQQGPRSDFNHDGLLNLSDVVLLAQHFLPCHECAVGGPPLEIGMGGEIGIFFDAAGTQTGSEGIAQFDYFTVYVVAFEAEGGIAGYEFGIGGSGGDFSITGAIFYPLDTALVVTSPDWYFVSTGGTCLPETGPVLLAELELRLWVEGETSIWLQGAAPSCLPAPGGPAYVTCEGICNQRFFYPAYQGGAVVNGVGPVRACTSTWGAVKTLYHR